MEELRNLKQMYSLAAGRFNQYEGKDFVLPRIFKEQVTEINSNTITYNDYSAVIETRGNQNGVLNIYLPNQWFYIASYFTEFYNELQRYKKEALKVVSKERLKDLNGSSLTEQEESRLQRLSLTEQSKSYLRRFMTDYSWWFGAKTIDRGDFYVSPILNSARLVNASQSFVADLCAFLANKTDLVQAIISGEEAASKKNNSSNSFSFQQIFYGAPGTGKSHKIKKLTKGKEVIRTTFHPDSDYSTFVGAYKPTTKRVPIYSTYGEKAVEVKDADGNPMTEDRIVYEFVEQAFLQAYIKAWKQFAKADEGKATEEVYLVIEEINRGNCAQIFGDLFQLLDRGEDGFSEYPIVADKDLQKQLAKAFADMPFLNAPAVCGMSAEEVAVKIRKGEILLLPNNLYIWATMNTSDQSLFPIDSAFKRRWDWQYMPIANGNKDWRISANGNEYDWWEFLEKINALIGEKTSSEDKKLGYYFCKPKDGLIDAKMFVGKVIFYLWNDVFKDYEFEGDAFNDVEGKLTFDKFYKTVDGTTSVVAEKVMLFLKNLEVVPVVENEDEDIENVDDPDSAEGKDYTRYTINGEGNYPKRQLSTQAVRKYIELHPELTPEQVVADWMSLGSIVSHFVETKEQFDARTDNSKRSHEVPCGDTKIYVAWNGWGIGSKMQTLITAVNSKDWGITLAIKE